METTTEGSGTIQERGVSAPRSYKAGTLGLTLLIVLAAMTLRSAFASLDVSVGRIALLVPIALVMLGLVVAGLAPASPVRGEVRREARPDGPGRRRRRPTIAGLMILVAVVAFLFGFIVADDPIPWLVGLACLGPFLLGPLVLRRDHWVLPDAALVPVSLEGPGLSTEVAPFHQAGEMKLAALGFLPIGRHLREGVPGASRSESVAYNAETLELATLSETAILTYRGRARSKLLFFRSMFEDGTEVVTSNNENPGFLPPLGGAIHGMAFPGLTDVGLLYRAHRARVAELADGKRPHDPIAGGLEAHQAMMTKRAHANWIARGYYELDEAEGVYRLTYKGAYLAAWRLMWPVRPIRRALRAYRARRMLRRFGLAPGGLRDD